MSTKRARGAELPWGATVSRRQFLKVTSGSAFFLAAAGSGLAGFPRLDALVDDAVAKTTLQSLIDRAPVARYWISSDGRGASCGACHEDGTVQGDFFDHGESIVKCTLCAQGCTIREGERGLCRARVNAGGELRSLVYGRPVSVHVDPIEKKPFYHFLPGSQAFSLATAGCPLHCKFCQNWEISQAAPEDFDTPYVPPEAVAQSAAGRGAPVIAFTYNEPTVFVEYFTDIARVARKRGIASVLVSCGFMNEEPLSEMCACLDAIKIDLKGYNEEFYRRVCRAELAPVLRSIKQVSKSGVHLEIVNLVVPTLNDSDEMLEGLARWLVDEVGPDVPVHFTRFHPDYQMLNLPPTPVETLENAWEIARAAGLRYAYVGNVPGHRGNHTYCPGCGKVVVARTGFFVTEMRVAGGRCEYCGETVAGVWSR